MGGVVVAIEVLTDEHRVLPRAIEPGSDRGFLPTRATELVEAPQRWTVAQDAVIVGVLTAQDRRPGGAAQGIGHERTTELCASPTQEVPGPGHVAEVRGSHVVGEH